VDPFPRRQVLTGIAGFGYTFFNEKLRDYSKPIGYEEFSGHIYDMLQPLVNQPGERWEYGVRRLVTAIREMLANS
jgi:hypothetical protein